MTDQNQPQKRAPTFQPQSTSPGAAQQSDPFNGAKHFAETLPDAGADTRRTALRSTKTD